MNRQYIIRRLLIAIPSLLGISVILFGVLAMAPGDPFEELATNPAIPPEVRQALRAKFGLDDPVWQRYLHWLSAMVQGDWGFSFQSRMDVDKLILQRLPVTLIVIGASQLLAISVAIPVGVLAAIKPYSIFDQIASTFAMIGFSLPTFFTGLVLILVFSHPARLAALRLSRRHQRHGLGLLLGAHQAVDHAGRGAGPRSRPARWCASCARPCST